MAEKKPPTPDIFAPLSDFERKLQQRILGQDLANIPSAFWGAVKRQMEQDPPQLLISDLPGTKGEESREVGATGQPAYNKNWVAFDGRGAWFYKDAAGRVHLEGVIKLGTIGTAAFTLPEGYRPRFGTRIFVVDSNSAFGRVTIDTAGVVTPVTGNNAYVALDGISFRAA